MARKVVKVYLSRQEKQMLEKICGKLGMAESEMMRLAFMDYCKSTNLIVDVIHGK